MAVVTEEFDFTQMTEGEDHLLLDVHRGWRPRNIGWAGGGGEQQMPSLRTEAYAPYVAGKRNAKPVEASVGGVGEAPRVFMPGKGMVLLEKILPAGRWGDTKCGLILWEGEADQPGSGRNIGVVPLSPGSWRRTLAVCAWYQEKAGLRLALPLSVRWSRWSIEVTDDHSPFSTHEHDPGLPHGLDATICAGDRRRAGQRVILSFHPLITPSPRVAVMRIHRPSLNLFIPLFIALWVPVAHSAEPMVLRVDFSKTDGTWNMPALALGQGGLQSDPMIQPHIKEIRALRPKTIRVFLSEYYRVYPDHNVYDFRKLDRELQAIRATGARPTLAVAIKPPVLFPEVNHFKVHPNDYGQWEKLCEALARHCRDKGYQVAAWEVCNEPDIGESGGAPQCFTKPKDYNTFYDHTVRELMRGDPDAFVGGPAVASADSPLVEGLIEHCATSGAPFHFLSWHLYSDSAEAHATNIKKQRRRLAKFPQFKDVKLFISEWNMNLGHPNLAPGFQPAFILETMRRYGEAGLDMAAYYHIRDCFVDRADFDWMSPGGVRFMAHW